MVVLLTVVVDLSTSIEIRVSKGLGANPFRVRDRAARVLPFSPELRYQLVACPSHLTMLSKLDVFYVFILSIPGHSPRRFIGLKLPYHRRAHRPPAVASAGTNSPP